MGLLFLGMIPLQPRSERESIYIPIFGKPPIIKHQGKRPKDYIAIIDLVAKISRLTK